MKPKQKLGWAMFLVPWFSPLALLGFIDWRLVIIVPGALCLLALWFYVADMLRQSE